MNLGSVAIINVSLNDDEHARLNDMAYLREMCVSVIEKVKLTALKEVEHQFEPQGISILYLLAESHLSIHTWPENNSFAMDIHSCNSGIDMDGVEKVLRSYLNIKECQSQVITRQLS